MRPTSSRAPGIGFPLLAATLVLWACDPGPTGTDQDPAPADCSEAVALPSFQPGDGFRITGAATRFICPPAPSASAEEYLLVVHLAAGSSLDTLEVQVRAENVLPPGDEPTPTPLAGDPARIGLHGLQLTGGADALPPMDHEQHDELRRRERRELEGLIRQGAPVAPPLAAGPASVPAVGSLLQFNAQSQSACQDPLYRTGRVRAVSSRAIVVADTLNPNGGFTDSDYAELALAFDTLVAPLAESAFGTATDIDGNGRVILFYTQEVNRLSVGGASTLVSGFFFARDLFPTEANDRFQACPHSNEAEILYFLVPDPNGTINGNVRALDVVKRTSLATLIHEYQHLINSARRLHIVQATVTTEEIWLNEGLSHMAEELLFYRASGLEPGRNLDVPELQSGGDRVITAMNRHQLSNALRLRRYLDGPHLNSPYHSRDLLATRGAAWHFLRYAVDRHGGTQSAFFRALVNGPAGGIENLAAPLGGQAVLHDWFADWSVALYADSRVEGLPPRYRDRSWNHASIYRHLDEQANISNPVYPLRPIELPGTGTRSRAVMGGGSAYFRFALDPQSAGHLELTVNGEPAPGTLRTTLLRIR